MGKKIECIIMAILYLAENNSALRASSSISYTAHNSYYRSLIEVNAKFDPFSKISLVALPRKKIFVAINSTWGSATGHKIIKQL